MINTLQYSPLYRIWNGVDILNRTYSEQSVHYRINKLVEYNKILRLRRIEEKNKLKHVTFITEDIPITFIKSLEQSDVSIKDDEYIMEYQ